MIPTQVLGRWHSETEAENKESRRLEKECAAMRRELHDSKCAEVAALPNVNEYADVLQMQPGPEKTRLLDEILEEKYKIDEEAADRWREEEGLPPLSKEEREAMLDKIMSDDDRKWLRSTKSARNRWTTSSSFGSSTIPTLVASTASRGGSARA